MSIRSAIHNLIVGSPLLPVAEAIHGALWHRRALRHGTFAQHGEDNFVLSYFGHGRPGTYIDVGANHPFKISNTYLLYLQGWRGVTLEPIPRLSRLHRKWRPEDNHLPCAAGRAKGELTFFELIPSVLSTFDEHEADRQIARGARLRSRIPVPVVTLADVCRRQFSARPVDVLSIDTEGFEFEVLNGMDWRLPHPKLIICETSRPGAQDDGDLITDFLGGHGYRLVKRADCNSFYEPAS